MSSPASSPVAAPNPTRVAAAPARILIVDDDDLVRSIMQRTLAKAGYQVIEACDGQEGLEVLERRDASVDLVIMDIVMPRMNGIEAARRIRNTFPSTPVLFCSGYDLAPGADRTRLDDLTPFLEKPFLPAALLEAIQPLLSRSRPDKPEAPA